MFDWIKKHDLVSTLHERGGEVVADARRSALEAARHLESLILLFREELREYSQRQARRMAFILVGAGLLLVSYLLFCAAACLLLGLWVDMVYAVAIVFLLNFLVGLALLRTGLKTRLGALAPLTQQEINNDFQCLKIVISEKKKS